MPVTNSVCCLFSVIFVLFYAWGSSQYKLLGTNRRNCIGMVTFLLLNEKAAGFIHDLNLM